MSDTARDYQTIEPAATEGLEDLFVEVLPEAGLGRPQVLPSEGLPGDHQGLPIEQTSSTTVQDSVLQVIQKQAEQLQQAYTYLDAATARVLYLQQQLEQKDQEMKLLTDSQHKNGWWSHFKKWFFGPVAR